MPTLVAVPPDPVDRHIAYSMPPPIHVDVQTRPAAVPLQTSDQAVPYCSSEVDGSPVQVTWSQFPDAVVQFPLAKHVAVTVPV